METRKSHYKTRQKTTKNKRTEDIENTWTLLPVEICEHIFTRLNCQELGILSMMSYSMQDMVASYIWSSRGTGIIVPKINSAVYGNKLLSIQKKYEQHHKCLGMYV